MRRGIILFWYDARLQWSIGPGLKFLYIQLLFRVRENGKDDVLVFEQGVPVLVWSSSMI